MKNFYFVILLVLLAGISFAQTNATELWQEVSVEAVNLTPGEEHAYAYLTNYRLLEGAPETLRPQLADGRKRIRTIELPMPNGNAVEVQIQLDPVIAPGLAERYPEIKTYRILPSRKIRGGRMGWTYQGLHATVHTADGTVYIDPYLPTNDRYYVSYYVRENVNSAAWSDFRCGVSGEQGVLDVEDHFPSSELIAMQDAQKTGTPIVQRKYRLAVACTGQFSQYHGGTTENALSAIVTIVNRLNEVFEIDLGIRAELIENTDELIFLNANTDPYGTDVDPELISINHNTIVNTIGLNAFDFGHVFGRVNVGVDGLAQVMSVCSPGGKGRAASFFTVPNGDPFTIDVVAHEMGHQFGGTHTMGSCHNMQFQTAYEPGSGSTILSYAGICNDTLGVVRNIEPHADPYYHVGSLQQLFQYMHNGGGDNCAEKTDFGNTIPEVMLSYVNDFSIPISTPFELSATATDMEGDDLTYCWEQFDVDPAGLVWPPGMQQGRQGLFRSFPPTESPNRTFPRIDRIVNNVNHRTEVLPTYERRMTFRCTVRDNFPASGAASWKEVRFFTDDEAGPFLVMSPNAGSETWQVGDFREVTWDVANTDNEAVNCQRVNIRLSTDGGFTYPITLVSNTPNDGSAFVSVPDAVTADARIRVEAADNIFFDISNADFEIMPATEPGYAMSAGPYLQDLCTPEPGLIDIVTASLLEYDSLLTLSISSAVPDDVEATFEPATLVPGESSTLTLDFTNSFFTGPLFLEIQAVSSDMDTSYREVELFVRNNRYDNLEQLAPFEGQADIQLSTEFMWTDLPNADTYELELATSPLFGETVIDSQIGIDTNIYTPSILLEDNALFYWRVRGANACGDGPWIGPKVFHTINAICQETASEDTPVAIPGTGPLPTRTSDISVPFDGVISDINIPNVNVQYQPIQNFRISLISPEDTEVILYDEDICFSTDRVSIGFDDDAPNEITCPPDDNIVFRPVGELSDFIGEGSQGIWTMKVQVFESGFGAPGSIDNWNIEFCAAAVATTPAILTNETLEVPPGLENPISSQELEISSTAAGPGQLVYTIVSLPENGTVKYLGEVIGIGDQFSQASINGYNVSYEHDGSATTTDQFTFVVQDGMGGFLPIQTFNIVIDENAVVNTYEVDPADEFRLFPNPTKDLVELRFAQPTRNSTPVRVFNLQGQLLQEVILPAASQRMDLDLSTYAAGLYLVQYGSRTERVVKF